MAATPSDSSQRHQALIQLLRTADILWEASRVFFARWELSPSQFNILNLLDGHPNGLSQTELGRELLTHRSNITGLVDRLEKRGLVRRNEAAGDRRAYRVVLASAGAHLLREIVPEYRKRADRVWDGIAPEKIGALGVTMGQVSRNAMNTTSQPHPKDRARKA
jgi:DNA-binding MarR family transcriptional regulator